ncbi:MAG: hypothetical protein R3C01_09580 [Planctomycetaceae bacterium]
MFRSTCSPIGAEDVLRVPELPLVGPAYSLRFFAAAPAVGASARSLRACAPGYVRNATSGY